MITWWQCWIDNGKTAFGFSSKDGVIVGKFPDYKLVGKKLSESKQWFINNNAVVVKICEQHGSLC